MSRTGGEPVLVLYDGVCNLCLGAVRFIARRDPESRFRFLPLQSEQASRFLGESPEVSPTALTLVVIDRGRLLLRSDAVLRIGAGLRPPWPLLRILGVVPRRFRDALYDALARNRYRWFGRQAACSPPSPDIADRFLPDS